MTAMPMRGLLAGRNGPMTLLGGVLIGLAAPPLPGAARPLPYPRRRRTTGDPALPGLSLYGRFGAAKLDRFAEKVLATRGEATFYCPSNAHPGD